MKALLDIVRFMLYLIILPLRIVTAVQYVNALIMYPKKTLTLDSKWRLGKHVEDTKCSNRYVVLWRSKIKRSPCPDWYKTYVAIKPPKK